MNLAREEDPRSTIPSCSCSKPEMSEDEEDVEDAAAAARMSPEVLPDYYGRVRIQCFSNDFGLETLQYFDYSSYLIMPRDLIAPDFDRTYPDGDAVDFLRFLQDKVVLMVENTVTGSYKHGTLFKCLHSIPGRCYLPMWMMQTLGLQNGSFVYIRRMMVDPPPIMQIRLQLMRNPNQLRSASMEDFVRTTIQRYECTSMFDLIPLNDGQITVFGYIRRQYPPGPTINYGKTFSIQTPAISNEQCLDVIYDD